MAYTQMADIDFLELRSRLEPLDGDLEEYFDGKNLWHPWIFDMGIDRDRAAWTNHWYRIKLRRWNNALAARDWQEFISVYERPHRLEGFYYISDELTDEEYWSILGFAWMDSENIWQNTESWRELWNCNRRQKPFSMPEEERAILAALPSELTIYRGFTEGRLEGLSWTLDYEKAVWFARRFARADAAVATARAKKEDVHAFFNERKEREIVIDKYVLVDQVELEIAE